MLPGLIKNLMLRGVTEDNRDCTVNVLFAHIKRDYGSFKEKTDLFLTFLNFSKKCCKFLFTDNINKKSASTLEALKKMLFTTL